MSVKEGRIRLYLADIRPLYQEKTFQRVYEMAEDGRRQKADACRTLQAKAASLAAGFLAEYALRDNGYGNCVIRCDENGAPKAVRKAENEKLMQSGAFISLSHSGDYAVCAIAGRPVGVDIQKEQPIRQSVLRHFLPETEREEFLARHGMREEGKAAEGYRPPLTSNIFLPDAARQEFLRLWTAKESFMKLTGLGMAAGFANIGVDLKEGLVYMGGEPDGQEKRVTGAVLKEYRAPEGYFLSACAEDSIQAGIRLL